MAIRRPTRDEIKRIGRGLGLSLDDEEAATYVGLMEAGLGAYDVVDSLEDVPPGQRYPRPTGHRPPPEENPHNAWHYRCVVPGAGTGLLAGRRTL